ncbi:MAG TPA: DUF1549 domain-containing protein [Bryobacterales bacterium]|nr:DUF1549 domain-containing protein [Bryobacterales bacterium]
MRFLILSFVAACTAAAATVTPANAPSFRNQVIPVITKVGCNSGACHGAAAGKHGFHLTLRGYDIYADYDMLTRQGTGRRVILTDPAHSLMLLKPTLTIPHGGGRRITVGSPEYKILSGWIAAGAPPPSDRDPIIQYIEFQPEQVSLHPNDHTQLKVTAHFSDGHTEDVTHWTKYSSGGEAVASVDDEGLVEVHGTGEAPITAWYQSKVAFARISVPAENKIDPAVFAKAPRSNFIDDAVIKKLEVLRIPPSAPATDSEFIRRAYLDAAGILPTAEETQRFLADRSPDKRARLIDALLERPEFVDYWTYKWADLLGINRDPLTNKGMWAFYDWLHASVAANKPWNQLTREILTATGNSYENGPVNFYRIHRTPEELSETTMQAFLGMRIMCAHCHNHPFEKWTQKDYYGLANFFARVNYKEGASPGDLTVLVSATGDVTHPRIGRPVPPAPLDGKPLPIASTLDRRRALADWITSPDNPYFARSFVNRVWANFMGRGLIEPVDDVRATNPATNEELLSQLTADFVQHHFDQRRLVRLIMSSAAYQRSSRPLAENAGDEIFYSHYILKRLPAEVILDAMSQVAGSAERFAGVPYGTRALQLPDTKVSSYFLDVFGRPPRVITCSCERQQEPSITQALHILNGATLNRKVSAPGGTIDSFLKVGLPADMILDHLYLSALSRYPAEKEKQALLAMVEANGGDVSSEAARNQKRAALEDILWSMLSGKEFLFNH